MMCSAIAHHPPTNTHLVPKRRFPCPHSPVPILDVTYGISRWPVWVSCPGCVLCQLLVPLQLSRWLGMRN